MNSSHAENTPKVVWGEPSNGLRLGLADKSGNVILHLENVGQVTLEVLSHVDAGEVHLDWFTLNLQDEQGGSHKLILLEDRDESGMVLADLAPGDDLQHRVDVADWANRAVNRHTALFPGYYQLSAVYDAPARGKNWVGHLEAGPIAWTLPTIQT